MESKHRFIFIYFLFFAASLVWQACADKIVTECQLQYDIVVEAKFSSIQKNVFNVSCALSGCHAGSEPTGGLNLEEGQSYNNLINVTSNFDPQIYRVVPENSQNSLLIGRINGSIRSTMPPSPANQLPQQVRDSIAAWIDRGAENN